ncbi:MAG: peptidoglycan DD-metalloendopeptidase family protein, partial [Flavihumibacter sp.]|nr:peptidoglycan DD-metalloendopeptidase family protein [Flavihumibacter sp.]
MMRTFFCLALLVCSLLAGAQQPNKSELDKQRAANQREMEALQQQLKDISKNKKASLAQLNQVQKKIQLREKQINLINQQIHLIEGNINQSWREVSKLKKELDTLKVQYAKSLVYSYKNRNNYDFLNFIFSSASFNDALKRVTYLRNYRNYREQQATNIQQTQVLLQQKIAGLSANRKEKNLALKDENDERKELEVEKKEKDAVVSKIKSREKELNKELAEKKRQDQKLAVAIRAAIARAQKEAIAAAARKPVVTAPTSANTTNTKPNSNSTATFPKSDNTNKRSVLDTDAESIALSTDFEKNRGSLPWPTSGVVAMKFGRQPVEGLNGIIVDNPGITIETNAEASVKAVFDGEVVAVTSVGPVQAVIIKHGRYFTSYSNLSSASVNKGQQIKRGQVIGRVMEKEDGKGDLEFLITNEQNKNFDPEK